MNNLSILNNFNNIKNVQESINKREDYIGDIKNKNPKIYNSWRAFMYTEKGKKIGHSKEWDDFRTFYNDVFPTYKKGLVFRRIDTNKPFSKDNFIWIAPKDANTLQDSKNKGETLTIKIE